MWSCVKQIANKWADLCSTKTRADLKTDNEILFPAGHRPVLYRMNTVVTVLSLCLAVVACPLPVHAFSSGAPSGACSTLSPDPSRHLGQPQSSPVPYNIDLAVFDDGNGSFSYQPGMSYQRERYKRFCNLAL